MYRLQNPIRHYAWGSRTQIPRLLGQDPDARPAAEMWMGAHPSAPSRLEDGRTLLQAITDEPAELLGPAVNSAFEGRLPFLMKLLAASEPLSLQVHPTSERARIRFAEQTAASIPFDAPERSYPDPSHKPELLYALTRFEGMAGFRDPTRTATILRELRLPWLDVVADRIEQSVTPFQTLRTVTTELLAIAGDDLAERLRALGSAASAAELRLHGLYGRRRNGTPADPSALERESIRVYAATADLIERYPADPGVFVTLLLNHVVLAAGEAMFIDAGVIHAYTSGFGVEIMATSDNVLRAGLTSKHVDVEELLEVANFTPVPPPLWGSLRPMASGSRVVIFSPPVAEFELMVAEVDLSADLSIRSGPQVVLCLDGEVSVTSSCDSLLLSKGGAAFVTGSESDIAIAGAGRVAVGRTPTPQIGVHRRRDDSV